MAITEEQEKACFEAGMMGNSIKDAFDGKLPAPEDVDEAMDAYQAGEEASSDFEFEDMEEAYEVWKSGN